MTVKNNTKTKKGKATSRKKKSANEAIKKELISIVMIAVSIFLIMSIFTSSGAGAAGNMISGILKGFFGIGAYIMPIAIISVSIYVLFDEKKTIPGAKLIMGIVLFLLVISFVHIINFQSGITFSGPIDYMVTYYNQGTITNGGLAGAVVGNFILGLMGYAGAFILLVTGIIVLAVLVTGRSFIGAVANSYSALKDKLSYEEYYDDEDDEEIYEEVYYYDDAYEEKLKPVPKPRKKADQRKPAEIYNIDEKREEKKRIKILLPGEEGEANIGKLQSALDIEFKTNSKAGAQADTNEAPEIIETKVIEKDETEKPEIKIKPIVADEEEPDIKFKGVGIEEGENAGIRAEKETSPVLKGEQDVVSTDIIKPDTEEKEYQPPPITLLKENPEKGKGTSKSQILENSKKLEETLKSFGVAAKVIEVSKGPTVTRYELSPGQGVKVSKISNLADDLALNLAANGIRIEAPIPGKAAVGIEVPNSETQTVYFREVIGDKNFSKFPSKLAFGLGKDIAGQIVVADIGKMPHLLIAGATGSGKSVCVNTLIASLIYKSAPDEVKLIMIDPKVVELSIYNGIPHLMIPVVTDPKKAAGALNWAVREMLQRYELFATSSVRDLKGYNALVDEHGGKKLPQIVIIIDELADLMMAAPGEVEDAICRLAQMARAAGLHLIIATQRPSVDVITGVIKANIPSRLAFSVSSGIDSRTILDMVGAEKLLGKGDMLFYPIGMNKPMRIQGAFISDKEVESIVEFLKKDTEVEYDAEIEKQITSASKSMDNDQEADPLFEEAAEFVIQKEKASASMLQRQFRIGYNRAARLVEYLESRGIVGPEDGSKPRKVLINSFQWQEMKEGKTEEK